MYLCNLQGNVLGCRRNKLNSVTSVICIYELLSQSKTMAWLSKQCSNLMVWTNEATYCCPDRPIPRAAKNHYLHHRGGFRALAMQWRTSTLSASSAVAKSGSSAAPWARPRPPPTSAPSPAPPALPWPSPRRRIAMPCASRPAPRSAPPHGFKLHMYKDTDQ
jgi:hypothetical protein